MRRHFRIFIKHFYPRPPRGGRPAGRLKHSMFKPFLSTPSARRATPALQNTCGHSHTISIHALREEGDRADRDAEVRPEQFLSTPSARRATQSSAKNSQGSGSDFYPRPPRGGRLRPALPDGGRSRYFYPRPPRGGRHPLSVFFPGSHVISIHALREEGDTKPLVFQMDTKISIHALREEGDPFPHIFSSHSDLFLSTPSARRATEHIARLIDLKEFLSTPSARRATNGTKARRTIIPISIHALREEGD